MENYHKVCIDKKEIFLQIWKKATRCGDDDALAAWENESLNFTKLVVASDYLKNSTEISLISSFIDIAVTGLSLNGGAKSEAYLESRSAKLNNAWVNVCRLTITAYGELNMRIRAGQIVRANNPIVLYEGDKFQPRTNENGDLMVDYAAQIPRTSNKIIGCYIQLILPHGGRDYKWLLEDDIARLCKASIPKNKEGAKANELYSKNNGQIDTGFLEAKTIKHAMRSYTKLRVSETVAMDGDDELYNDQEQVFAPTVQEKKTMTIQQDDEIF